MADEGCLPVVVEVVVADRDAVASVGDVQETIVAKHLSARPQARTEGGVLVLVMVLVAGEIVVVDPHLGSSLDTNSITGIS